LTSAAACAPTLRSRFLEPLREATAFLTPASHSERAPSPAAMELFPVVGAGIGLIEGIVWCGARRMWPDLPAAALAVAADVALTGALHLDGLADAADGLFAHVPVKDRLEIMAEPDLGTFGATALVLSLLARAAALSSLEPSPLLLSALTCCSRSVMVVASRALPYARDAGLVTPFLPTTGGPDAARRFAIAGIGASVLLAGIGHGRRGVLGLLAGCVSGAAVLAVSRRRVGGFTGDVLGAAGVVCETIGLLVAASR